MNTIKYIIFLFLLVGKPAFVGIKQLDIITLKDKRQVILFGDNHNFGSFEKNLLEAYLFYDLIESFAKENPNKPILILPEMLFYAPEGLSHDDVEAMMSTTTNGQFPDLREILQGGKIGQEFFIQSFKTIFPTWINLSSPLLLPILEKLLSIPNLSIIPTDPRVGLLQEGNLKHSIFDIGGFPKSFTDRYWRKGWKNNINKKYHSYFENHFTNWPKHLISSLLLDISTILNIDHDEIFKKPWKNLYLKDKKQILLNKHKMLNTLYNNYHIETSFDGELLYQILNKKNNDYKVIFGILGADHCKRIVKALNDLNMIKQIKSQDFDMKDGTTEFSDFPDLLVDINKFYKDYDFQIYKNILEKIKVLHEGNKTPRDSSGYSLLGYLVTYKESFIEGDYQYNVDNLSYSFVKAALEAGADPNVIEPDGKTPLMRALYHMSFDTDFTKYEEILSLLIEHGANTLNPAVGVLLKTLKRKIPIKLYPAILFEIERTNNQKRMEIRKKGHYFFD